ncbi:hypothetical protein R3P38DRAFT_3185244 [Favolaschia claudopus]|uniref:Uncharacterized protein n=1 Tax=Favolaschia claudopus TaxID=2862362 RepID=A0AAW0C7Q6_9AGAR
MSARSDFIEAGWSPSPPMNIARICLTAWTELLQTNDYSWGTIDMPCMSNTIADSEPASSASNSDAWSSVGGNSQVPEDWFFRLFSEPLPSYGTRTIEEAMPFGGETWNRNAVICSWISQPTSNFAPR